MIMIVKKLFSSQYLNFKTSFGFSRYIFRNFTEQINIFSRIFAVGLFVFVLLGKPAVDVILFGTVDLNSFVFSIFFSPLVAIGFLAFEPSKYWVRILGFFYSVLIFISTYVLVTFFEYSTLGFSVYFEFSIFFCSIPLGLDNFSILFIVLTSFLVSVTFLSCWSNTKFILYFFELLFIIEFSLFGVFMVLDLFWFFVAYEAVIVPIFLIIGIWGGRVQRIYAAYLFFYYTFAGSIAMLFSIAYIYVVVGSTSFVVVESFEFTTLEQLLLFGSFFIAFVSKLPLYPFHSWLPEAHVEAPTAGSVLLAGILLKMGGYGLVRWCFSLFPLASFSFVNFAMTIAGLSILYASFSALQQLDIKRVIAYSSIAHMGFVVIGLFTFNEVGFLGSIFLMISHGFISAGLFLCVGILYDRYGTRSILYYGGIGQLMPIYDAIFFVFCLANIALPGTAGFPGEFLVLYAVYQSFPFFFIILLVGVLLTGIYTIWMYARVMMGPFNFSNFVFKFSDVSARELCMFTLILIPTFIFGLFPMFLFHIYNFWIFLNSFLMRINIFSILLYN